MTASPLSTALTVRNLDPDVKTRLRVQAAQQGIAMEECVRRILTRAVNEATVTPAIDTSLGRRIHERFAKLYQGDSAGIGEFRIAPRTPMRAPPFVSDAA